MPKLLDAKSYQIEHFEPKIEILLEHIEFWIFEKFDCGREENFIQPIMVSKKIGFQRDYKIMRGPLYIQNDYFLSCLPIHKTFISGIPLF